MPAASASPPPRQRRHSLSDDEGHDDRPSRPDDHRRDRPRRMRDSPSSDRDRDGRREHHRSRRHRDASSDSVGASNEEQRPARRRGRDRSRSRSRSRHGRRSRSRSRSRDRNERKKRRYDDRSTSPPRRHHHHHHHHHHRSDRRKDRAESPRHSRRSRHDRHDHRSRSPSPKRRRPSTSASPPRKRSSKPLPSQEAAYRGEASGDAAATPPAEKQRPNFKQTGLLAREANTVAGTDIVLKYNEPPDARKPPARDEWRLFVFKGDECVRTVELWGRSCWLVGREAAVADLLVEHPSTSKQHAVLQFRHTVRVGESGDRDARVRPYLIDLESSNGTLLNGKPIEPSRYVEVMDKDVIKFGLSEREYVLMLPPA